MIAPVTPRREIGFWTAVSLVVGSMIGSGVFLLPANLAPYGGIRPRPLRMIPNR